MTAYNYGGAYANNLTLNYIQSCGYTVALYSVIGTNGHVALRTQFGSPLNNVTMLVIQTERKVALYKQAMAMQMGKPFSPVELIKRTIRLKQISEEDGKNYTYSLYTANT